MDGASLSASSSQSNRSLLSCTAEKKLNRSSLFSDLPSFPKYRHRLGSCLMWCELLFLFNEWYCAFVKTNPIEKAVATWCCFGQKLLFGIFLKPTFASFTSLHSKSSLGKMWHLRQEVLNIAQIFIFVLHSQTITSWLKLIFESKFFPIPFL